MIHWSFLMSEHTHNEYTLKSLDTQPGIGPNTVVFYMSPVHVVQHGMWDNIKYKECNFKHDRFKTIDTN